jgi:hypothetical protein
MSLNKPKRSRRKPVKILHPLSLSVLMQTTKSKPDKPGDFVLITMLKSLFLLMEAFQSFGANVSEYNENEVFDLKFDSAGLSCQEIILSRVFCEPMARGDRRTLFPGKPEAHVSQRLQNRPFS